MIPNSPPPPLPLSPHLHIPDSPPPSQQAAQEKRLKQLEEEARKKDPSKAFALKLPDILPYFSVSPVDVELRPWSAVTLVFKGQASKIGTYVCVPAVWLVSYGDSIGYIG